MSNELCQLTQINWAKGFQSRRGGPHQVRKLTCCTPFHIGDSARIRVRILAMSCENIDKAVRHHERTYKANSIRYTQRQYPGIALQKLRIVAGNTIMHGLEIVGHVLSASSAAVTIFLG
jgi:hypothetical protein